MPLRASGSPARDVCAWTTDLVFSVRLRDEEMRSQRLTPVPAIRALTQAMLLQSAFASSHHLVAGGSSSSAAGSSAAANPRNRRLALNRVG